MATIDTITAGTSDTTVLSGRIGAVLLLAVLAVNTNTPDVHLPDGQGRDDCLVPADVIRHQAESRQGISPSCTMASLPSGARR